MIDNDKLFKAKIISTNPFDYRVSKCGKMSFKK